MTQKVMTWAVLSSIVLLVKVASASYLDPRGDPLPCQAPPEVPRARSFEESYELQSVQVMTRHGARTSVFSLPGNGTNEDIEWKCNLRHFDSIDAPRRYYRKSYLNDAEFLPRGNCANGQLTERGSKMHVHLGTEYRRRYVEALNISSIEEIYVRSTDVPRVFASVESNLAGMFPPAEDDEFQRAGTIYTVDNAQDPLASPNQICPLGEQISAARMKDAAATAFITSRQKDIRPILEKFNLSEWNMWETIAIPDQVVARKCSMDNSPILPLPNGVTYAEARSIFDVAIWLSFHELNTTRMRRLSMGLLVREMIDNIDAIVRGDSNARRMVFYSAHDTTVYPLVNAFGAWNGEEPWPPFASHVELELWKSSDRMRTKSALQQQEMFAVALSYNGRSMRIFDCPELCPLVRFKELMRDIAATSREAYLEECGGISDELKRREGTNWRRLLNA